MAEKTPKYQSILEEIRRGIEAREYTPGQRLPSDKELARRFDTSRLTVIRALRELADTGMVQRAAGSGTFVKEPSAARSQTFGILMPDLEEGEVFEPISQGIASAAEATHERVLWGNPSMQDMTKEDKALQLCRYFLSRRVSGVFFSPVELSPHQSEINEQIVSELDAAGIAIILIDRCYKPFPERSRHDLVAIDNRRAGFRMTRHLLKEGASRPAFACRSGSASTVAAREAGYREALAIANGGANHALRFESDDMLDQGRLHEFLRTAKPDAFVCANDLTAAHLMHTLLKMGVRIPADLRMVGINDVKYARFLPVPLTTLRQPCRQIGFAAMTAMLQRLENRDMPAQDILLDCELVERNSCGPRASS